MKRDKEPCKYYLVCSDYRFIKDLCYDGFEHCPTYRNLIRKEPNGTVVKVNNTIKMPSGVIIERKIEKVVKHGNK